MSLEEKITEFLLDQFQDVYCGTCDSQLNRKYCDSCNRRAMNWQLSENSAKYLASNIIKIIEVEK